MSVFSDGTENRLASYKILMPHLPAEFTDGNSGQFGRSSRRDKVLGYRLES
jgi:hypothetical protein